MNLTRFGDLLQSQAAIAELARQGHQVGLVCQENFAEAAALLSEVTYTAPLPGAAFLAGLAVAEEGRSGDRGWPSVLGSLSAWREDLWSAFPPDHVVNLTPSLAARLLAFFLAKGVPCSGFAVDEHGFGINGNAWAAFLQGASLERGVSPFNVVDLFRKVAVRDCPALPGLSSLLLPSKESRQAARRMLRELEPEGCRGFVALQLGASENRRRWPVSFFAELGDSLWKEERLCPVLLGSKGEQVLADHYASGARCPPVDLCGRTSLMELASVLCEVRLLITNDTGTMHLAAGLERPVLAIFLATAQPFDTGPYRERSCSVEPDMDCHPCAFGAACSREEACRQAVRPEKMLALALSQLRQGRWDEGEQGGARVWLSEFDEQGFMALRSLSGHGNGGRALWLDLQRSSLRAFLDREKQGFFRPSPWKRTRPLPRAQCDELLPVAQRAASLVELLAQQGRVVAAGRHEQMGERFLATWQKVYTLLRVSPGFAALAVLWLQETQAPGKDLPVVLEAVDDFGRLLEALVCELQQ